VNAETLPASQLACLLYDAADGLCADVAAVMLIDRHGHFLHQPAFRRLIAAGSSITTGQPLAVIRWNAAIHALESGQLPCSGSFSELCKPSCKVGMSHQVTVAIRVLKARRG